MPEDSRYCFSDTLRFYCQAGLYPGLLLTHYQLGVAQAHCEDFVNAEKSLKAAISVLDKRVVNLKKMEMSENIKKELAELDTLCYDIKERMNDHKDMQKGVYKQDKDFVSVFKSKFLLISLIELKLNISL